jgi:hypothetical protein
MTEYITTPIEDLTILNVLKKFVVADGCFIAGGCFKNLFNHERVKDIDMFFAKESDYLNAIDEFAKDETYQETYEGKNAYGIKIGNTSIDLVHKVYGTKEEILNSFDFTVTKFIMYRKGDEYFAMYSKKFFEDLMNKKLVIDDRIDYPLSTFNRALRYSKYGYVMCRQSKIKLLSSIMNHQIDDVDIEEELTRGLYESLD